jgi:hypothetical protein
MRVERKVQSGEGDIPGVPEAPLLPSQYLTRRMGRCRFQIITIKDMGTVAVIS